MLCITFVKQKQLFCTYKIEKCIQGDALYIAEPANRITTIKSVAQRLQNFEDDSNAGP